MSAYHESVLLKEAVDGLDIITGGRYIDATYGGGGHALAMVRKGAVVLGIDADEDALIEARGNTVSGITVISGNFRDIAAIAKEHEFCPVDGILFDLGVSGHQLDEAARGFSYRFEEAPLDMRFDRSQGKTAADILAYENETELERIFAKYGEEERAGSIAHAIVHARQVKKPETAGDLMAILGEHVRGIDQGARSRIFQALRIAVNDELQALKDALLGAGNIVKPGGRVAVITFHSLEDRIVKRMFTEPVFVPVTKKPVTAGREEIIRNRRARSAKLRIARKV